MMRLKLGLAIGLLLLGAACSPQQPVVTPQAVQITGVGTSGLRLRADLNAYNPNDFGLTLQTVSGHIVLGSSVPLGTALTPTSVFLPANGWQRFFVDLEMPWLNLPAALALAQAQPLVPYTFEGEATIGGALSITLPIRMQGTIPAQDLLRASIGLPRFGTAPPSPGGDSFVVIDLRSEGEPIPELRVQPRGAPPPADGTRGLSG